MMKSKNLKRAFSFIMTLVFCLGAFAPTMYAEGPEYALKGTINSALEIMSGETEWTAGTSTGEIKIQLRSDAGNGAIFTAYKLLNIQNDGGVLKVSIPNDAKAFWNYYTDKADATVLDIKNKINSVSGEAEKSSSIVNKFLEFTGSKPAGKSSAAAVGGTTTIDTEFGFYAVLQTGAPVNGYIASAPVLACLPMQRTSDSKWLSSFTIVPKDDKISVTKQVQATDDAGLKNETITNIGDTVEYEIISELPEYGADIINSGITYTLEDKLPSGVTINKSSLKLTIKKKGETTFEDTALVTATYDDLTSKITANIENYATNINKTYEAIKITYSAVLNKDAVIESDGNVNTATLKYTSHVGEFSTTSADAKVYTMGLDAKKVDDATRAALAGAEFEVHKQADGTDAAIQFVETTGADGIQRYRVATQTEIGDAGVEKVTTIKVTNTDGANKGMLMIDGLNDAKYYLKETKAPSNYNLPGDLFEIDVKPTAVSDYNVNGELDFDGTRLAVEVENSTGIDLPITGGIGTVIFTLIGLLLMAGAAYFLFFNKKTNK